MAENLDIQALKDDIEKLKEQMNDMLGMKDQVAKILKLLEKKNVDESTSAGNAGNVAASLPPTHNSVLDGQNYQWLPYGLPVGYTPPTMDATLNGAPTEVVNPNHNMPPSQNKTPQAHIPIAIPLVASQAHTPLLTTSCQIPVNPTVISMGDLQANDKYQMLEERLRGIEGLDTGARDAYDLCLVPDVVIPPKFKMPDFVKYRGVTCPASHLTMYCRKMAAFAHDDKLLIHYFQESLAGAASSWYMQLERTHIRCWKDLADAFLRQYKYNIDMAPDRAQLQNMVKRNSESFREYAQRWRGLAAQVTPPLLEKEMVSMFMNTLQSPFYEKLIGSVSSNFSDMVTIGERLENGMRNGKITHGSTETSNPKSPFSRFESNSITGSRKAFYTSRNHPQPLHSILQTGKSHKPPKYPERKHVQFDPVPVSYSDLFDQLTSRHLISPRPMKPIEPPFPRGYDGNATCEFHAGAVGHSVENCKALKHVIQDLIDSKWLSFNNGVPNVGINPFPGA